MVKFLSDKLTREINYRQLNEDMSGQIITLYEKLVENLLNKTENLEKKTKS